jgi:ABC-2 type transport system ATP-binding protein
MQHPMIVVEDLHKSFPMAYGVASYLKLWGRPPRRTVLHGVNLTVARGELLGLLGPNGAGKTTLLKSLATLAIPDRGRVLIDGIDVVREPLRAKQKIGLCISEERSFYYRLTARANLEFFGALVGLHGRSLARRIDEVLEQVQLRAEIDQRFSTFSSGMRQRLTVARALLGDPEVILLDEPTRAVDPIHAEELRRFFRKRLIDELGKTVILATNLLEEAWRLCDRVAVINGGSIVALGPPHSLDTELHHIARYQITLASEDGALVTQVQSIPGVRIPSVVTDPESITLEVEVQGSGDALKRLLGMLSSKGCTLRSLKSIEVSPVDVFAKITAANNGG